MLHFQQKGQFYGVDSARNHLCFQRGIWRGSRKNAFRGDGNRAETSKTRAANDFCWGVRRPINPKGKEGSLDRRHFPARRHRGIFVDRANLLPVRVPPQPSDTNWSLTLHPLHEKRLIASVENFDTPVAKDRGRHDCSLSVFATNEPTDPAGRKCEDSSDCDNPLECVLHRVFLRAGFDTRTIAEAGEVTSLAGGGAA